jgi:hypothetical protein
LGYLADAVRFGGQNLLTKSAHRAGEVRGHSAASYTQDVSGRVGVEVEQQAQCHDFSLPRRKTRQRRGEVAIKASAHVLMRDIMLREWHLPATPTPPRHAHV